jgi:nucleotide-binding universal stress UspA family protein
MSSKRRAYEPGHKPKCLVLIDDTPECDQAVHYAGRWAMRIDGSVVMLRVIETDDLNQQWLGVADIMQAEAEDDANTALDRASGLIYTVAAMTPERVVRKGDPIRQILQVIDENPDICVLALAASAGAEGPGPILSLLSKTVNSLAIPLLIVPGALSDEQIDALS